MTAASKTRSRKTTPKPKADWKPKESAWRQAFMDYRALLAVGFVYILAVTAESIYAGVPLAQFARVGFALMLVLIKCVMLLVGIGIGVFVKEFIQEKKERGWKRVMAAHERMTEMAGRYLEADVFAYGCLGILVLFANDFYFIQKCLIHVLHPFAWDDAFIGWEKALHFGKFPHEYVIALSDSLHLGRLLDSAYFLWFAVMYAGLGYNMFWDSDLQRRMRFIWCFLLCWILLGSVVAMYFSTTGPLFYHDFFPDRPDPYREFVQYFHDRGPTDFPIAYWSGVHLLQWTTNGNMVNMNAVAAFPSLHIAIAWLITLYGFSIRRGLGIAGAIFTALIFLATVLFGYHYALDGYFSFAAVSVMWWVSGLIADRKYPAAIALKRI